MITFQQLLEKTLTPAEKKKREEIAKAIEKDNPDMPMGKKMAIATATAKRVAESDFEPHMMYDPKTGKGYKANKPEDHVRMKKMGYTHEKPELKENYRTAARHGMGTEGKKEARVGLELDYYEPVRGDKKFGTIVKKDAKGYTVKDSKTGKMHKFAYHDRIKARKFLDKLEGVSEDGQYVSPSQMTDKQKADLKAKQQAERERRMRQMKMGQKDSEEERARKQRERERRLRQYAGKRESVEELGEDSNMAINPKTVNKSKPMLMKYAKKFGVDLEFGVGGKLPSVLQIKSKSSQAEKGFLDAVGKDKKLMQLLDHVEHDLKSFSEIMEVSQQAQIRKAIDIASSMGGNMTGAVKRIEAIKKGLSKHKNVRKALQLANEEIVSEEKKSISSLRMIDKLFNTKGDKMYQYGVAKMLTMTGVKVAQSMQKQNPKGFERTMIAMGKDPKVKLPIERSLQKMFTDQGFKMTEEVISEVTDVEINLMKQLSKDAEKLKKNYALIVKAGDKELKDRKYNKEYKTILDMQQAVLSLVGKLQTKKIIDDSKSRKESLEEKLNKQDLKFMSMMYDKKGNLTDVGKAVMNYKPGDNIRKIVQNLNKKEAVSPAQQAAIAISKKEKGEKPINEIFGISQDPRYRAKVMKMLDDEGIKYKKDGRNALIILGVAPKDQKKLLDRIHKQFGMSSYSMIDESNARRDAMRSMRNDPDFQPKGFKDITATDADRKAASKNVLMQIRKATDLPKGGEIEFPSGKKGKISQADAKKVDKMFNVLKKPQDKEKFQKVISKDLNSIKNLLKRLGR